MVREPVVQGRFYPENPKKLGAVLDKMVPPCGTRVKAIGALSPHAGYMCSGEVAGKVYARMEPSGTYIILGPSHTGYGAPFAISDEKWRTPLGLVDVDHGLIDLLVNNTDLFKIDPAGHTGEHSIEVQIPFIQRTAPGALIVPITVKWDGLRELAEVGRAVALSIREAPRRVTIIASSDMTHYEPRDAAGRKDRQAIEKILDMDAKGLFDKVHGSNISMCGYLPATVMLFAAQELDVQKSELIEYTDSGDVTGDISDVVGYAGIVLY